MHPPTKPFAHPPTNRPVNADPLLHWDVFCRVVDNFGDIGVCWRLSSDLAARGHTVRLWVDDASALAFMAPSGASGVSVHAWPDAQAAANVAPGDVVIEAFGCELPAHFVAAMAKRPDPPRWINLEYLSAEDYVERSHGLISPVLSGPGLGLIKHFFYPGFTASTGGLLREENLLAHQQAFDPSAWLQAQGITTQPTERLISLFAYPNAPLDTLLDSLRAQPTRLLVPPGPLVEPLRRWLAQQPTHQPVTAQFLPLMSQTDYDHLLWSCDLNLVRGEDSFVRAQWAGRPFLWQIYRQDDGAHEVKLQAFLARYLEGAAPSLAQSVTELHRQWNGLTRSPAAQPCAFPEARVWWQHSATWREQLAAQDDLCAQLLHFAQEAR